MGFFTRDRGTVAVATRTKALSLSHTGMLARQPEASLTDTWNPEHMHLTGEVCTYAGMPVPTNRCQATCGMSTCTLWATSVFAGAQGLRDEPQRIQARSSHMTSLVRVQGMLVLS